MILSDDFTILMPALAVVHLADDLYEQTNMVKEQRLTHKQLLKIHHNHAMAAETVNLVYINDGTEGIRRAKKGKGFAYLFREQVVKDKATIQRIRKLAIPPAWEKVWICQMENGHLQATGYDARSRKQYRYHPLWNYLRNETKYHHLLGVW